MIGVEICGRKTLSPAECTDQILEAMKEAGYLLGKTGPGRNVLTWMPPLITESEALMEAVAALERVLQTL
jgi:4-aminobutyrate aminotransferase